LVSVCFPLYRSRRFVETIVENVAAIAYPNIEIIFSDQHQLDDATTVLRERFDSDERTRFIEGRAGINWVENFNLLARSATGKYFLWMGHDDSYPSSYISDLVDALEEHPEAVLAFGRVEQVSLDGYLPTFPFTPPPVGNDEAWSLGCSLRMLTLWHLWIPFRGLVRRAVVEQSNLFIRQTYGNIRADVCWLFGLSLKGRLYFVPSCHCTKRFYRSSAGAGWRFGIRQSLNACLVLRSYLKDLAASRREALVGQAVVYLWCLTQGFLPAKLARKLGIVTRHLLVSQP
jgi:glycosyltransferase involved in cell wall biosynthesis